MITTKHILKILEKDKLSFKKDRIISRTDAEWHEANGIVRYIRQLINDIKIQEAPLNDALSDTEIKHAL